MISYISSRLSLLMRAISAICVHVSPCSASSGDPLKSFGFVVIRKPALGTARLFIAGAFLVLCSQAFVKASLVLTPPTLNAGSQYRLVFSTSTTIQATSTNIATYNTFVNSVAASNLQLSGISWTAIASTPDVDARDNTNTNPFIDGAGVPIYNLAGSRLALGYADLWDATLENPVGVDEFANPTTTDVWTGTGIFGEEDFNTLGLGLAIVTAGKVTQSNASWIRGATLANTGQALSIYAVSSVLTVPIPEPTTGLLLGLAVGAWAAGRRRQVLR